MWMATSVYLSLPLVVRINKKVENRWSKVNESKIKDTIFTSRDPATMVSGMHIYKLGLDKIDRNYRVKINQLLKSKTK